MIVHRRRDIGWIRPTPSGRLVPIPCCRISVGWNVDVWMRKILVISSLPEWIHDGVLVKVVRPRWWCETRYLDEPFIAQLESNAECGFVTLASKHLQLRGYRSGTLDHERENLCEHILQMIFTISMVNFKLSHRRLVEALSWLFLETSGCCV